MTSGQERISSINEQVSKQKEITYSKGKYTFGHIKI